MNRLHSAKKTLALLLAFVMLVSLAACKKTEPEPTTPTTQPTTAPTTAPTEPATEPGGPVVGISMPDETVARWRNDGERIVAALEAQGIVCELRYAHDAVTTQVAQLEELIASGVRVLVVAPVLGDSLTTVLEKAKQAGITVIAYDRQITQSDAVGYFCGFDSNAVGIAQGKYIETALDLANADDVVYTIELDTGGKLDTDAQTYLDGAMSVLKPYFDAKKLSALSGKLAFDEKADEVFSAEQTQEYFKDILAKHYKKQPLHAVLAVSDAAARGVVQALESGYKSSVYPIITGMGFEKENALLVLEGKQTMSVLLDTRDLADLAAQMCQALLAGQVPQINNSGEDLGYPACLCAPRVCTAENARELIAALYPKLLPEERPDPASVYEVGSDKSSYTILDGVTEIPDRMFANDSKVQQVSIPDTVTRIGYKAFYNCTNLKSVSVPKSVTAITYCSFADCTRLAEVTLPDALTAIDSYAFLNCRALSEITVPNGVTEIGSCAFAGCEKLTRITIPASVTAIGMDAFLKCDSLTDIYYAGTKEQWQKIAYDDGDTPIPTPQGMHYNTTG